jgi:hypothetical protein
MQNFNTSTPRNNPRLIVTVNSDQSATVRGCYINTSEHVASFTRAFNSEAQALQHLHTMRDNGAEFALQISRKA